MGVSFELAGTIYTVVDDKTIIDQIANENYNLCTTSVSTFFGLFEANTSFNSYIGFWDTSNVIDMNRLFNGAAQFNQSLSRWNTSKVLYMPNVFSDTEAFNQDISNWDTSNVERMDQMFARSKFNQNIGSWKVGNVTNMDLMFSGASQFNQDLSNWCVSQILNEPENFTDQDSVLSEENKPIWGSCPNRASQSFNLQVLLFENNSTDFRVLLNEDREGGLNGDADPDLHFNIGDSVNFEVNTPGHPFYLKTVQGTGTSNLISGVTNNGATNGTVTWTPTAAGTYYYQCSLHNGMNGTITVN